jgi:hypothetical protein
VRIAEFFGLTAGQIFDPGLDFSGDRRCLAGPRPVTERYHRTIGQRPLNAALGRLMVHAHGTPYRKNDGFFRYASSIRARSTRLAGSELERQIACSAAASSSSIANSIARAIPS